jgi:hypothetical protein
MFFPKNKKLRIKKEKKLVDIKNNVTNFSIFI